MECELGTGKFVRAGTLELSALPRREYPGQPAVSLYMTFRTVLRLLVACFAAGTLFAAPQPPPAGTNHASYYPLWQKAPPNMTDMVLIYQGGTQRSAWAPGEFAPYVSAVDPRDHTEKWLFDGFLFIEFVNGRKHAFEEGLRLPPADKQDWQDLLARNFEPGHGLAALEQTCAETEKRIGPPLRPRQVVLTLPEPIEGATNWGALDGRRLDFSVPADRVAACEWHIDNALRKWRELAPRHLTLAGFYFVPERTAGFECPVPAAHRAKDPCARPAVLLDSLLGRARRRGVEAARLRRRLAATELLLSSRPARVAVGAGLRVCPAARHGPGDGAG